MITAFEMSCINVAHLGVVEGIEESAESNCNHVELVGNNLTCKLYVAKTTVNKSRNTISLMLNKPHSDFVSCLWLP